MFERKLRPARPSGWVGTSIKWIRETRHRKRAQTNRRKYQRHSMNWKIGRLTQAYHVPASENLGPSGDGVAYHAREIVAALDLQPVRASDYRTLITVATREAAATEQGAPITKAVIEALKDRMLLVPVPELLIRLALAGRAAARRQAYRELIRGLEQSSIDALDQLLAERVGDRSHLGWIAEAPEGAKLKNLKGLIARLEVLGCHHFR